METVTARLVIKDTDGNLVLYRKEGGVALWATMSDEAADYDFDLTEAANTAAFEADGDFVVRNTADEVVWSTSISYGTGDLLTLDADDVLTLWDGAAVVWSTE